MDLEKVEFKNEKRYLSNMYPCKIKFDSSYQELYPEIEFDDKIYDSSEHIYQALKSNDLKWRELILNTKRPEDTKNYAHKYLREEKTILHGDNIFEIRKDWHEIKYRVMEIIVFLKFSQNEDLKAKLLATGEEHIEERNCWNDRYWGTVDGIGENNLGKILMAVREKLRNL